MNTPSTGGEAPSGMKSAPGSDGSLADRPGTSGFPTGTVTSVSGSATKEPDRDQAGFEVAR